MIPTLVSLVVAGCVYSLWQLWTLGVLLRTPEQAAMSPPGSPRGEAWIRPLAALLPESTARQQTQKRQLRACGFHGALSWHIFQALRFVLTAVPLLAGLVFLNFLGTDSQPMTLVLTAVLPILLPILGWSLPGVVIARAATARQAAITAALPDLLTMVHASVQSGRPVARALSDGIGPMELLHPELANELLVLQRRSTVTGWPQAVGELADTFPGGAISRVCRLLQESHRLGNRAKDTLIQHADDITDLLHHEAEQTMQRVSVQLLFPVVLCLLPSVFVQLAGPSLLAVEDFRRSNEGQPQEAAAAPDSAGTRLQIPLDIAP